MGRRKKVVKICDFCKNNGCFALKFELQELNELRNTETQVVLFCFVL